MNNQQAKSRTRSHTILWALFFLVYGLFSAPLSTASKLSIPKYVPIKLTPLLPSVQNQFPARHIVQQSENIPEWKTVWDKARRLAEQKDYQAALSEYHHLMTIKENLAEARWELVILLLQQNDFTRASDNLEMLLENGPEKEKYIVIQGVLAQKKNQFERSFELLDKLFKNSTVYDALLLSGLANALHATGKMEECLEILGKLLSINPSDTAVKLNAAVLAYDLGQFDLARPHVAEIISEGQSSLSLLVMAARIHVRLRLPKDAAQYWQKILVVQPHNIEAHERLASYYENQGNLAKAIVHLLILKEKKSPDLIYLKRIGQVYLGLQKFDLALEYFTKYITGEPDDKEVVRYLIKIHAAMGDKIKTINSLEHYFSIETRPEKNDLQQAAELYDESGYYKAAIPIYRRLLDMTPDDPELLWALAQNLLATGQEEDALKVWRQLAEVVPGVVDIYRPMAILLERKGRDRELLEVLTVIHGLEPGDQQVVFKLAGYHYRDGNFDLSMEFIEKLLGEMRHRPEFFRWRGNIWESRGELVLALDDFGELLILEPLQDTIRLKCVRFSGMVGDLKLLNKHIAYFASEKGELPSSSQIIVGQALMGCGDFSRAFHIFEKIVIGVLHDNGKGRFNSADINHNEFLAFTGLAESYQELDLPFEAEQVLRQGLAVSGDSRFIPELFGLAIAEGRIDDAREWLIYFRQLKGQEDWSVSLMRARYHVIYGELSFAETIGLELLDKLSNSLDDIPNESGVDSINSSDSDWAQKMLEVADLFFSLDDNEKAFGIYEMLSKREGDLLAVKVLSHRIYQESMGLLGDKFAPQFEKMKPDEMLAYGALFIKHKMYRELAEVADRFLKVRPHSLRGRLDLAKARIGLGEKDEAVIIYNKILTEMPDNQSALVALSKHYFDSGKLSEAEEISLIINSEDYRADIQLLTARLFWLQHKWDEAIGIYLNFLDPSVEEQLKVEAGKLKLQLPYAEDERSFIEKVIQIGEEPVSIVAEVMSPKFMHNNSDAQWQRFFPKSTAMYGRFRWQNKFAGELQIRQAVQRREYVLAAKQYEAFIRRNPEDVHLLFDLAGVYSRTGRLGDEAALYDRLMELNVNYPELSENMARNRLKQRPFVTAEFGYDKEEGRQGHKDLEKNWQGLRYWYSSATQTEVEVVAGRYNYLSVDCGDVVRGNRLFSTYQTGLWRGITAVVGGGLFSLDDGDADNVLLSASLAGKFGDRFSGVVSLKRDVVEDTVSSLTREVILQSLEAGISADLFPRLEVGGDYFYNDYSDNNWTTGYDFWSSYILFSEPTFLKMYYKYDFKESYEGENGSAVLGSFTPENHPYWAPKNYWTNSFGVFFKHIFEEETLGREAPKYYTAEYYFGHDSDGYAFQTIKGGFFVELCPSWFIKSSVEVTTSQQFRKKQLAVSASYRW